MESLVCHRGYHHVDDSITRPVENTAAAYRAAWFDRDFSLCECDATTTSDSVLILCHDANFKRLAKNPNSPEADAPVCELEWKTVSKIELLDGSTPATLKEVLEIALEGESKKLVIELKFDSASQRTIDALETLFRVEPRLRAAVAVVMSFAFPLVVGSSEVLKPLLPYADFMLLTESPEHWKETTGTYLSDVAAEDFVSTNSQRLRDLEGIDGVYIEYQLEMTSDAESKKRLQLAASKFVVGVWGYAHHPDGLLLYEELLELGVKFVNTDLPEEALNDRKRSAAKRIKL